MFSSSVLCLNWCKWNVIGSIPIVELKQVGAASESSLCLGGFEWSKRLDWIGLQTLSIICKFLFPFLFGVHDISNKWVLFQFWKVQYFHILQYFSVKKYEILLIVSLEILLSISCFWIQDYFAASFMSTNRMLMSSLTSLTLKPKAFYISSKFHHHTSLLEMLLHPNISIYLFQKCNGLQINLWLSDYPLCPIARGAIASKCWRHFLSPS